MKKTITISDKKPKGYRKRDTTTINLTAKPKRRRNRRPRKIRARVRRNNPILGTVDRENYVSTAKMLDSLFVADRGISRGIAFGATPTALLTCKQSFEVIVPASSYAVLMCQVNSLANASQTIIGGNGSAGGGITNLSNMQVMNTTNFPPANPNPPGTLAWEQVVAGPFNVSNPSTAWRVVSFTMSVTPDTNVLNQGGWYQIAHCNQLGQGTFVPASSTPAAYTGPLTYFDFLQYGMLTTFKGTQTAIYHQIPSADEIQLNSTNSGTTNFEASGPIVVFQSPTQATNPTTYKITYQFGVEYIANNNSRLLVQQYLSDVHPSAEYEMNQFAAANWDRFVIAEKCEWENAILDLPDVSHDYVLKGGYNKSTGLAMLYSQTRARGNRKQSLMSKIMDDTHTTSFDTDNRQIGKSITPRYKSTKTYYDSWKNDFDYV